jgi:hypothetical protein
MWYPAKPAACVVTARGYAAQFPTAPFHAFCVSPNPGAGGAWAADDESIVRLEGDGRLVAGIRTPGGSQKWMCPVPPG